MSYFECCKKVCLQNLCQYEYQNQVQPEQSEEANKEALKIQKPSKQVEVGRLKVLKNSQDLLNAVQQQETTFQNSLVSTNDSQQTIQFLQSIIGSKVETVDALQLKLTVIESQNLQIGTIFEINSQGIKGGSRQDAVTIVGTQQEFQQFPLQLQSADIVIPNGSQEFESQHFAIYFESCNFSKFSCQIIFHRRLIPKKRYLYAHKCSDKNLNGLSCIIWRVTNDSKLNIGWLHINRLLKRVNKIKSIVSILQSVLLILTSKLLKQAETLPVILLSQISLQVDINALLVLLMPNELFKMDILRNLAQMEPGIPLYRLLLAEPALIYNKMFFKAGKTLFQANLNQEQSNQYIFQLQVSF